MNNPRQFPEQLWRDRLIGRSTGATSAPSLLVRRPLVHPSLRMGFEIGRPDPLPRAIGLQIERRGLGIEEDGQGVVEPFLVPRIGEGGQDLHPPIEVAAHEIGRADQVQWLALALPVGESIDA